LSGFNQKLIILGLAWCLIIIPFAGWGINTAIAVGGLWNMIFVLVFFVVAPTIASVFWWFSEV